MHQVTLGQYQNLKLKGVPFYTENELENTVVQSVIQSAHAWAKHNLPIEKSDKITLRIEAKLDGMIVPQLCNSKMELSVGDPSMLPQFSAAIGKKLGDTFTMLVQFDQNTPIERIMGKAVDFEATILDVLHVVPPVIDDDFARIYDPESKGLDDLKAKFRRIIENNAKENFYEKDLEMVMQVLIANSTIQFDQKEFDATKELIVKQSKALLLSSNLPDPEKVLQGVNEDAFFLSDCHSMTVKALSEQAILAEIIKQEAITISKTDFLENKAAFTQTVEALAEFNAIFPTDALFEDFLTKEKVRQLLIEWNLTR